MKIHFKDTISPIFLSTKQLMRLIISSIIVGIISGIIGGAFHKAVDIATSIRINNSIIILFLPFAGLFIALIYSLAKLKKDPGTNAVISSVHGEDTVPVIMAPLIFVATFVTHLFGGSAGREGAALQLGGSIGSYVGKKLKSDDKTLPIIILCGMSGVFSALFGTPLTAVIFACEVCLVGAFFHSALIPCFISSYTALYISSKYGNHPVSFNVLEIPNMSFQTIMSVILFGLLCALVTIIFCKAMHKTHEFASRKIENLYLRTFTGGVIVVLLTILLRTTDYNGAGMDIINSAIHGNAVLYAFILKIVFTAISIGFGFKGGEIVPTFFIGATFGCIVGPIIGLPASFSAALGISALFASVVNCPIAAILLSVEIFGGQGLLLYATAIFISTIVSGYCGLYGKQKFLYSNLYFETVNNNKE